MVGRNECVNPSEIAERFCVSGKTATRISRVFRDLMAGLAPRRLREAVDLATVADRGLWRPYQPGEEEDLHAWIGAGWPRGIAPRIRANDPYAAVADASLGELLFKYQHRGESTSERFSLVIAKAMRPGP